MARILIIEDEEQIRIIFREILERSGYEVEVAADGEEGIKLQQEKEADLIITDIVMPEKEGLETIQELRRKFPRVEIIAISGGGQIGADEYLDLAKRFGAACCLNKPILPNELVETVSTVLHGEG